MKIRSENASVLLVLTLLLATAPVLAQPHGDHVESRLDQRGDRIEQRLDRRGGHIDHRLDHRADLAAANGRYGRAERLDTRGDLADQRLDRRGEGVDRRLDRRGARYNRWH